MKMFRLYIERKNGFENEVNRIFDEIKSFLGINGITGLRYLNRYDIENVSEETIQNAACRIFSEPQSDECFFNHIPLKKDDIVIAWEYLPGQYDQRSDSAEQCLSLLTGGKPSSVRCAKMVILSGKITPSEVEKIQKYLINPVDSRLASLEIPETLKMITEQPGDIPIFEGFINRSKDELSKLRAEMGLAMDDADICFLQDYFKKENRDPTETEIRVLDTYWSDHCRHTTFNTVLDNIQIEETELTKPIICSLNEYKNLRQELYAERAENGEKPITLMDMACIGAKYLKKHGKLDDIELSAEINACSIYIDVDVTDCKNAVNEAKGNTKTERWLLQFKNETHNHPTEIEPFGGAATCIGGAIRDPLSGRAWVYQALRVTGAADPTVPLSATRPGKLPQMKLTREAAAGFSSYGNQIGLTTGQVAEIYDAGFEAKRMELGAVIAAVPAEVVKREEPEKGDVVILVGGGTGRDGIGGATGSSKVHTEKSVTTAAAEVQKGNAVEERKIQRLFRNRDVCNMIRRCNDFGAGGVSVAVGELAPGLDINLDAVPKKYEGLNGTELAISESQERMALVVRAKDVEAVVQAAESENLNATVIATVTDTNRLVMKWKGKTIVDIDRNFLDTAGAQKNSDAAITSPKKEDSPLCRPLASVEDVLCDCATGDDCAASDDCVGVQKSGEIARNGEASASVQKSGEIARNGEASASDDCSGASKLKKAWLTNLSDLAVCSQRGLQERFDGSIGSATINFPFGGKYQATPESGCTAKIPVLPPFETETSSLMTFGYDPRVAKWSPYHGAQTAVLYSLTKIACLGGRPETSRLTFQEYFERTVNEKAWGKPTAALLGALSAQKAMGTAAIGGKDSMSGTFQDINVPPTLVSFAVATEKACNINSGAFKKAQTKVYFVPSIYNGDLTPNFEDFNKNANILYELNKSKKVNAIYPVGAGGIAEAVTKMSFGNKIGFAFDESSYQKLQKAFAVQTGILNDKGITCSSWQLFMPFYGSMIAEVLCENEADFVKAFNGKALLLGTTVAERKIFVKDAIIDIEEALNVWEKPLSTVFPPITKGKDKNAATLPDFALAEHSSLAESRKIVNFAKPSTKPKVLLPVFPGTNCEYDMARAFALSGAEPKILVFRNNTPKALEESLQSLQKELSTTQILALSGGFSAGDEPDGSAKFICNVLRESRIADGVMNLLENKDGLVLGICNGFQALIKVGLVPYGKIISPSEEMPTLTFNCINRHISRVARTRIVSANSPWAQDSSVLSAKTHLVPISHGEGRIIISDELAKELFANGQVFTQYVNEDGIPVMSEPDNPNGSMFAIEGITSKDGRVLGKMGHSERTIGAELGGKSSALLKNIEGDTCQNIFVAGVRYFK